MSKPQPPEPIPTITPVIAPSIDLTSEEVRKSNPLANAPSYPSAPVMVPTPAEYKRDAILDKEEREAAILRNQETEIALVEGRLPPAAETLEEARESRAKAKKPAVGPESK